MLIVINSKTKEIATIDDNVENRSLLRGVFEDMGTPKPNEAIRSLQLKLEGQWASIDDMNQFFDGPVAIVRF